MSGLQIDPRIELEGVREGYRVLRTEYERILAENNLLRAKMEQIIKACQPIKSSPNVRYILNLAEEAAK